MDIQQRKINRLCEYDYSTDGIYFVTICTQNRRNILSSIVGDGFPVPKPYGTIAEEFIRQIPEKYPSVSVDKYVIMPDHIHLLLRFGLKEEIDAPSSVLVDVKLGTGNPSPTLGTVIGWYKYQVTKQINLYMGVNGERIFQRSYYDHVIRNEQDYNDIWQYIENNPKKWLIEKRGYE